MTYLTRIGTAVRADGVNAAKTPPPVVASPGSLGDLSGHDVLIVDDIAGSGPLPERRVRSRGLSIFRRISRREVRRQMKSSAIWQPQDMFPLAAVTSQPFANGEHSENIIPFGLRYLVDPDPSSNCDLDLALVRFDDAAQMAVVSSESDMVPVFKHTSGQTSTTTNVHDRKASDSDSDYEQDR